MENKNYSKTTHKNKKTTLNFYCELCDYSSSNNSNYNKHLRTKKHLAKCDTKSRKWQKKEKKEKTKFFKTCQFCNYNASKKYNWEKHIKTMKHKQKVAKSGKKVAKSGKSVKNQTNSHNNMDKLELLAKQVNLLTTTLNKVVETPTHTTINNNQTNNISFNLFLDKHCHNAQSLQDFVDNITFKLNDILKEDDVIENFVSIKMLKNLNDIPITERPIHCTDQKRKNFFVKDKNEGWVKDVTCNEIYDSVNQLQKKAYMDFYNEYDKINPLPHDTVTENIKCKISSELLKPPPKIVINDIAKNVDIKDAFETIIMENIPTDISLNNKK
tara:strand:- start:1968 stop:2948 length:981 start_codon:yes stop_codon:yes gene_type:complete